MTGTEFDVERLRAALRAAGEGSRPRDDCPPPERLWSALQRELPAETRREVIAHLAGCSSCSEAWRLAVEMLPEPVPEESPDRSWLPDWLGARPFIPLATAAVLAVAVGAGLLFNRSPGVPVEPGYRENRSPRILSRVAEDEALPRDAFLLRWSPGPEGSRYAVRVTTESLEPVASVTRLTAPEWILPESALAPLPPRSRLLWQVEVRLPSGERRESETFVASLR